jgi:hypothetical protein
MRVLCVGRHAFLSEHLCRVFGEVGATCEQAVGAPEALAVATHFEPQVVVCDCDVLTPVVLGRWAAEPALADVPVLAVSLTRRPDDATSADRYVDSPAAVIYLPSLDRTQIAALLTSVHRTRVVPNPPEWRSLPEPSVVHPL